VAASMSTLDRHGFSYIFILGGTSTTKEWRATASYQINKGGKTDFDGASRIKFY
jgi:hypothetical protein